MHTTKTFHLINIHSFAENMRWIKNYDNKYEKYNYKENYHKTVKFKNDITHMKLFISPTYSKSEKKNIIQLKVLRATRDSGRATVCHKLY